ncbi:prolyl oligopeptidase family serine peptidase [Haloferacaceae archaeon DSL9]
MNPLPLDAYYDLTTIADVALSPDGTRAAFVATEYDQTDDEQVGSLFVVPADGSRPPHRLTRTSGAGSPKWSPDGDRLAFLAAREEDAEKRVGWTDREADEKDDADEADGDTAAEESDESDGDRASNGADDEPKTQVWCFDLSLGGDARQLTDREDGVREFDWAPDGDRLVIAARDPTDDEREYLDRREDGGPIETERLQHKLDGVGWLDTVTTYLFVVDLDDGAETRLDDAYGGGAMEGLRGLQPAWGPDDRIAFVSCRTERPDNTYVSDIYLIDSEGSNLECATDQDLSAAAPAWSPSGDLAFFGGDPENWCIPTQLFVLDGDEYASLTAELDRTVGRGADIQWADDETLYTLVGDEARTRLIRVSTDGTVERVFDAQGSDRALLQADLESGTAALRLSHPTDGHDVYAVDIADLDAETAADASSLRRLSSANESLTDEFDMPTVRRVSYDSGGWEIDGVVYHDPEIDLEEGPHPLVVAIHGGPISYDEPIFSFDHAALTSRGYVIFRPNYRGGSSYGRQFAETLRGRWGSVEVDDIVAGVEDLIDRGWADADRVFGYGFSYGGIAQGYLVTRHPDLLTAAAPEHGIYDLRSAYGTDDSHVWMEHEYGLPWEIPDAIDASSSITDVGNIATPLLVTAGGQDWRCPPSQSEQLYVAAKKQGVEAKLVVYPDEHHNIGDPDRAIHRLRELVAWYERHDPSIGGDDEAAEDSADDEGSLDDGTTA